MTIPGYVVQIRNNTLMSRRRILVPIDFKAHSDAALYYARKIACKQNDMISCIYVMEEEGIRPHLELGERSDPRKRREAETRLSEKVHSILKPEDKTPFELIITSGKVHEKIVEKAKYLNAGLIVMGYSGSMDKRKSRIGTNAKKVISKSHVPVITVKNKRSGDDNYIIVPVDLFKPFKNQIQCAIDTARPLNAGVCVLSVLHRDMLSLEPECRSRLKEIRHLLGEEGISCTTRLLLAQSSVSEKILSFSNRIDSGLILMMTQQGNGSGTSKLGSITREVIANAEVPVQCFNPDYITENQALTEGASIF